MDRTYGVYQNPYQVTANPSYNNYDVRQMPTQPGTMPQETHQHTHTHTHHHTHHHHHHHHHTGTTTTGQM
ncbi:hypothetical protein J5Y03_14865 [Bacillus sp. RG28]|uniref:Uncharacterized protein n=1 Tax=Gottfriedia endophytica TaxID=2820819 RepID=A0A940SJW3_9BACI|nr:hypothetical protein [Gottfriedia endophytica]MBP0726440.1 hypothetical protein [Gottfriedia endophytica]